jgi:hypothetical protein
MTGGIDRVTERSCERIDSDNTNIRDKTRYYLYGFFNVISNDMLHVRYTRESENRFLDKTNESRFDVTVKSNGDTVFFL